MNDRDYFKAIRETLVNDAVVGLDQFSERSEFKFGNHAARVWEILDLLEPTSDAVGERFTCAL